MAVSQARIRCVAMAVAALLMALPASAGAQTSDDERARAHFDSGRLHYDEGAYDRALAEFTSAHDLSGRPVMLLNMANANERLGRLADAAQNVRDYLVSVPDAPNRTQLERRIENLERLMTEQRVAAAEATSASDEADTVAAAAPSPTRTRLAGPLAAYGVGAAGVVMFAVAAPMTFAEDRSLSRGCGATSDCSRGDVARAHRLALVADIGIGVAVAGAAVGTVLLLLNRKRDRSQGDVAVSPYATPNAAGLVTQGRF